MSQDNQKRIEVLEITDSKTGRTSGGISIGVVAKDSLMGKFLADIIGQDGKQPSSVSDTLTALLGAGHKFNDVIGHTGIAFRPSPEQAQALLEQLKKARTPRPEHQNLKNRTLDRHPILDLLTSPALMHLQALGRGQSKKHPILDDITSMAFHSALNNPSARGQSKTHPMDALLAELMGGVGCGECTACGGDIDTSSTTLEIAGQLLEGSQILNLGLEAGAVEDLNEEQKAIVLDRLKNIRKNLKSFIKALED